MRFGLVAYRDDPAKVKDIEYLARTFADPNKIKGADDFKLAVEGPSPRPRSRPALSPRTATPASTQAIQGIDWTGFGGAPLS